MLCYTWTSFEEDKDYGKRTVSCCYYYYYYWYLINEYILALFGVYDLTIHLIFIRHPLYNHLAMEKNIENIHISD